MTEKPIPTCTDCITTTEATRSYTDKLLSTLPQLNNDARKKFAKTPRRPYIKQPTYSFNSKKFPSLPKNPKTNKTAKNDSYTPASDSNKPNTTAAAFSEDPNNNKHDNNNLAPMQEEIKDIKKFSKPTLSPSSKPRSPPT